MGRKLVVLISGWGKGELVWKPLSKRFAKFGYDTIIAKYPKSGFGNIEDSACSITVLLQEVRAHYDKLILCGHSMGGLVARAIIQQIEYTDVDAYISLGSPHRGTYLAYLAPWSESAKQMKVNSGFLTYLNGLEWPSNVPALGLQAQFEGIIMPTSSAQIEFGINQMVPYTTHITLPLRQRTFQEMWAWLTYGVFKETGQFYEYGHASTTDVSREAP